MSSLTNVKSYWEKVGLSNIDEQYKDHWLHVDGSPVSDRMYGEVANFVIQHLGDLSGRLLEVGCGTGRILEKLNLSGCTDLHGIDFSSAQIHLSCARNPDVRFSVGDFFEYTDEFLDFSFDLIYLHSDTQYFPSEDYFDEFIARAVERLNPGGKILLIDVPIDWYKNEMIAYRWEDRRYKKMKSFLPAALLAGVRSLRRARLVREVIGGTAIEYRAFNGLYASLEKIYSLCDKYNFSLDMIYQSFTAKPVKYRKYRPFFILSNLARYHFAEASEQ